VANSGNSGISGNSGVVPSGAGGGPAPSVSVSGAVSTIQVLGRDVHTFTGAGNLIVTTGPFDIEYFLVGGGAGGNGGLSGNWYGGGGAGGVARSGVVLGLAPGTYAIAVGAGSAGVIAGTPATGGSTTGLGFTATGGSGKINTVRTGGDNADFTGGAGAGASSGGGAGAGGVATGTDAVNGGVGIATSMRGAPEFFGGGGGGTRATGGPSVAGVGGSGVGANGGADGAPTNPVASTGSGGGGGNSSNSGSGGAAGVAIFRVLNTDEAEVSTYISNVVAAGGSVSATNRALLNRLISTAKTDGWWTAIQDWYFPSGSDSFAGAMVPLKRATGLGNFVNNGFTATEWSTSGLAGTGTQWVATGFVPSTHIADYNSFNASIEVTNYVTDGSYPIIMGVKDGSKGLTFYTSSAPDGGFEIYEGSTNTFLSSALGNGTVVGNRSAVNNHQLFFNGSLMSTNGGTRTVTPPTFELFIHARNFDNSFTFNYSSSRLLSVALGSSQTAAQILAMRTAIAAYKTAKGI
jgi:hypothetical protein